jgi:predicted secreted Zn-dependent protease
MTLEPADLNTAYDELMTWGPRLGMPLIPRIQERLLNISLEYALALEKEVLNAQTLANALCEKAFAGKLTQEQVKAALLKKFSWIDDANFAHAYNQGGYYAWHG